MSELDAAKEANPISVGEDTVEVDDRRPKSGAYGGANYGGTRGGSNRGGRNWENRGGREGGRGNYSNRDRPMRGRGAIQTAQV